MRTLVDRIMTWFGYVPRGTNTVVHEIRPVEREVKWTAADSHAWHKFRQSETWGKLSAMSADSMIQALLPRSGPYRDDPSLQQAFVLGRTMQLEYLAEFAVAAPEPDKPSPLADFAEDE
jgi:hypothetical protein